MRDPIDDRKLHHLAGQKPQRPSCSPFRRLATGHRDQPRLAHTIELSSSRWVIWLFLFQCPFQTFFHEPPSDLRHRVRSHPKGIRRPLVRPVRSVRIHFQENTRTADLPCACSSLRHQCLQFPSFLSRQSNDVLLHHPTHPPATYGRAVFNLLQPSFSSLTRH